MTDRHPRPGVPPVGRRAASVDDVIALYERWGADRYDEQLSQLEHALQTAALAGTAGAPDPVVVAALLHDVGHLLALASGRPAGGGDPLDPAPPDEVDLGHEAVGARYLAGLFPPTVTGPISLHVRAKRYRCTVDPAYHDSLSAGSRSSLVRQGGRLDPAARAAFERHPGFAVAVALRGWDDGGKVDGLRVPGLGDHRALLQRVAIEP